MSDNVFEAVIDQARRSGDKESLKRALALGLAAMAKSKEIEAVREHRALWRTVNRNGSRNGALVTLEMHPLEVKACKILCPMLEHADWQAKKRGWGWILRQSYGKEFAPAPFEQTRF